MLLSLGGHLETAFALPAIYSNTFPPPSDSAEGSVTEYPDGGWFEYDLARHRWLIKGVQNVVIEGAENMALNTKRFALNADQAEINVEMTLNGGVTQRGGAMSSNDVVLGAHTHGGVKSGGDTSGGPQ